MKEKDYRKIRGFIEQETMCGNIEALKNLRDFLNEQISLYEASIEQPLPGASESVERFDILNLELTEFLTVPTYGLKFFRNDLVHAIKRMKKLKGTVLVMDTIGIGETILLQEKGIGSRTVGKYEHALNRYGYSLNHPLSEEQLKQFKIYQKKNSKV